MIQLFDLTSIYFGKIVLIKGDKVVKQMGCSVAIKDEDNSFSVIRTHVDIEKLQKKGPISFEPEYPFLNALTEKEKEQFITNDLIDKVFERRDKLEKFKAGQKILSKKRAKAL